MQYDLPRSPDRSTAPGDDDGIMGVPAAGAPYTRGFADLASDIGARIAAAGPTTLSRILTVTVTLSATAGEYVELPGTSLTGLPDWFYLHVASNDGSGDYILLGKADIASYDSTAGTAASRNNGRSVPDAVGSGQDMFLSSQVDPADPLLVAFSGNAFRGASETFEFYRGTVIGTGVTIHTEGRDPTDSDGNVDDIWFQIRSDEGAVVWKKITATEWLRLINIPNPTRAIAALQAITADLHAGDTPTWADAASDTEGGMVLSSVPADVATAAALTSWARKISTGFTGALWAVLRIPIADAPQQVRVAHTSNTGVVYNDGVTSWTRIGEDASWAYYVSPSPIGGATASLQLQVTGDANHVGSTRFDGQLNRARVYDLVKEILIGGTDDDAAETITLPAGGAGGAGRIVPTQVGSSISVNNTTVVGPALTDLANVMLWDLEYTRAPDSGLHMSGIVLKDEVDGLVFQFQGAGSAHMDVSVVADALRFDNTGAGAVSLIVLRIFNLTTDGSSDGQNTPTRDAVDAALQWDNVDPWPEGSVCIFGSRWWEAHVDIPAGAIEPALNPDWIDITPTISGEETASDEANPTAQITVRRLGVTEKLDVGGPVVPGVITRAQGHDIPATVHVAWTMGTTPPVRVLEPLSFPGGLLVGDHIGLEVTATGGGGGTAPTLAIEARAADGTQLSQQVEIQIDEKLRYYDLHIVAVPADGEYHLTAEALGGSDSGDFTLEFWDVLGFHGTNKPGRLIAQIGARLINLDHEGEDMGLTLQEVIEQINLQVPPAQRIPPLAGHGDALVRVATDATAVHLVAPGDIADAVTAEWAQPGQSEPGGAGALTPYHFTQGADDLPPMTVIDTVPNTTHVDTWDPDQDMVNAIIAAKEFDLRRPLAITGFVDLYTTKLEPVVATSGSLRTIYVEFGVKRSNGTFHRLDFLVPYINTTLAQWNQQYADVGDQANTFSAAPQVTVAVSKNYIIGANTLWDVRPGDHMAMRIEAGNINGPSKARINYRDIVMEMPGPAWAAS